MKQPSYFAPFDKPQDDIEATSCSPSCVLDAFYLGIEDDLPLELVVIIGCAIGGTHILRSGDISQVPAPLQRQVHMVRASQRDQLRKIRANAVDVFVVDSVEHRSMAGFNDAVMLFGRWCAQLQRGDDVLLHQPGCLSVGRLDLLYAFYLGLNHFWKSPEGNGETTFHFMLPTGPIEEIEQGGGIGLVYPSFEEDVAHHADNSAASMRLIYDVLIQMQQDLKAAGNRHKFVSAVLPVPSRRRLEIELEGAGYSIRGNEAIKLRQPLPKPAEGEAAPDGLLARLRRMRAEWGADRIDLPPQATLADYHKLVGQALRLCVGPDDKLVLQALAARVWDGAPDRARKRVLESEPQAERWFNIGFDDEIAATLRQTRQRPSAPSKPKRAKRAKQ